MVTDWQQRLGDLESVARTIGQGPLPEGAREDLNRLTGQMFRHVATGHEELVARALRLHLLFDVASKEKRRDRAHGQLHEAETVRIANRLWPAIGDDSASFGILGAALGEGVEDQERQIAKLLLTARKARDKKRYVRPLRLGVATIEYPAAARAAGLEARVQIRFLVDEDGTAVVLDVPTLNVPTSLVLGTIALVSSATFEPATVSGRPVPSELTLDLEFQDP